MTSTTVGQLNAASSTLQEARVLLSENKLGEVSGKLLEAAKAVAEAEVATNNLVASSTQAVPVTAPSSEGTGNNTSSTTPVTSTASSSASSTTTSPP
jgi:hypothetical protein